MRRVLVAVVAVVVAGAAVGAGLALGASGSGRAQWVSRDLGTLGGKNSGVLAVNDRGQIFGLSTGPRGVRQVFVWERGKMRSLGVMRTSPATGFHDQALVNGRGQMVVLSRDGKRLFFWEKGRQIALGTLGGKEITVRALNDRGQVVGNGETASGAMHAFLWQNGKMTDLGTLPGGKKSWAFAVNDRGQVVGASDDGIKIPGLEQSPFPQAVLWQSGKVRDLGNLPGGRAGLAVGINERGQVIGWGSAADPEQHSFLWQNGKMTDLGTPTGTDIEWRGSEARAINERGQVVGVSENRQDGGFHAFLWQNGTMRDLGTLGGRSSFAIAVNDLGQVIGTSDTPTSSPESQETPSFVWENGTMTVLPGRVTAINNNGWIIGSNGGHAVLWTKTG